MLPSGLAHVVLRLSGRRCSCCPPRGIRGCRSSAAAWWEARARARTSSRWPTPRRWARSSAPAPRWPSSACRAASWPRRTRRSTTCWAASPRRGATSSARCPAPPSALQRFEALLGQPAARAGAAPGGAPRPRALLGRTSHGQRERRGGRVRLQPPALPHALRGGHRHHAQALHARAPLSPHARGVSALRAQPPRAWARWPPRWAMPIKRTSRVSSASTRASRRRAISRYSPTSSSTCP
jgi:hypothetical protein